MDDGASSMTETGVVLRLLPVAVGRSPRVVVRVEPGEHCEGCGAGALCHAATDERREIEADDPLGCAAGDQVRVEVPDGQVLRMSFLIYGLPLLLLLGGVGLGAVLIPEGPWRDPGSFLLAVGFAAAALPVVRLVAGRHGETGEALRARIVARLDDGSAVGGGKEKQG
jgi:positive regulator of sigma E activity